MSAGEHWRRELAAWRIPDEVVAAATESPWVLPRHVFTRRADRQLARPDGASYRAALEALDPPGTVLDVGAGAGAASLPLTPRCTAVTAVDSDAELLAEFARRAAQTGVPARTVHGSWPEVAGQVPVADVVLCHHVIYNVSELAAFARSLAGHARRLVVVETAQRHPLTTLNALWLRIHGIRRPEGPTADDALAVLTEAGIEPRVWRWQRPRSADHADFDTLVDVTRRRLCLPPQRAGEVAAALAELGPGGAAEPAAGAVPDLGSSGDDVVTLAWPGTAAG